MFWIPMACRSRVRASRLPRWVIETAGPPTPPPALRGYRNGRPTIARAALAGSSQTDDRGEYRLIGLAPGDYYVQVELLPRGEQLLTGVWDDFPRITYYPGVVDPKRAGKITIGGSQDLASIDMKVPIVTSFKISGSVINPF